MSLETETCTGNAENDDSKHKNIITNSNDTPETLLMDKEMDHDLELILQKLSKREREVLDLYLVCGTQQVTANKLGISQSYVSRILKRVGNKILENSKYRNRRDLI